MKPIVLNSAQRQEIERRRKKTLDRLLYQRLTSVLAVAAGRAPEDVAHLLGVDLTQLSHWLHVFRSEGLEALCTLADGEQIPYNN
jgi:transcriptional regulator with XRE-family HTH domain